MQNAEHFLQSMVMMDESIDNDDYEAAISYALSIVPKIDYDRYMGEIGGLGTFYSDSRESRWYPRMNPRDVAIILAGEML